MERLAELENARGELCFALSYQREKNYLYAEWFGCALRQNIVDGGQLQIDWARAHAARLGTSVVVNDTRHMRGGWEPAVEWATQVYAPSMYEVGMRLNAVILSPDLSTQVSSEAMVDHVASGAIAMQVFSSLPDAERWIAEHAAHLTE